MNSWGEINSTYAELRGFLCPNALSKNLPSTIAFSVSDKTFLSNILKKLLSDTLILLKWRNSYNFWKKKWTSQPKQNQTKKQPRNQPNKT